MRDPKRAVVEPLEANLHEFEKINTLSSDIEKMLCVQNCNQYSSHGNSEVTYICTAPVCTKRFICDK